VAKVLSNKTAAILAVPTRETFAELQAECHNNQQQFWIRYTGLVPLKTILYEVVALYELSVFIKVILWKLTYCLTLTLANFILYGIKYQFIYFKKQSLIWSS
jgi:hypothetical protein